jgi:hypothetical protein
LAACSGNLGSGGVGGGLPAAPGQTYQQPQGPGSSGPADRERAVEGAVFVTPTLDSIPLPTVDGFSLVLALSSPAPSASPSAVPSGTPSSAAHGLRQHASRVVQVAQASVPSATPVASPSAAPSTAPSSAASGAASAGPSASPKAGAHASPSPHPTGTGPKIDTKLVIYPNYAPDAPTPEPTGNVQTYTKRDPIVRGYISPAVDVVLYGLGAARFTIPTSEELPGRGYTIAIFSSAKHKKPHLIANDTSASIADDVISSSLATPLTLKKGTGYDIVLYGDELPSTPPPVQPGYATPGSNPFVSPPPSGYPQMPGQPGQPYPGGPNGIQTYPPPGATPTPFPTR